MINSITLLGSSSGRNAGDAALIAGIMDSIDTHLGRPIKYEIPTINAPYILNQYDNNTKPISMMPWSLSVKMLGLPTYNSIMRTDLTLLFDAILFDRSLYNPLFNFMSTLHLMLPIAKRKGKKMGFFNVGAGPVNTAHGQKMLKELSEIMDFITVRDQASYDIINNLGVQNPRMLLAADAAVNLRPCEDEKADKIFNDIGLDPNQDILAINVNRYIDTWADDSNRTPMGKEKFAATYAKAIDNMVEKTGAPVLFVNTQHHDIEIAEAVRGQMKSKSWIVNNREVNHYAIKGVLKKCSMLFGMRLHANILASSAHTPIIGLNYQPKVQFYFTDLGLPEYTISFDDFSVDGLTAHLLNGWENRPHIQSVLDRRIPQLQQKADEAALLVKAIDQGTSIDDTFNDLKTRYAEIG